MADLIDRQAAIALAKDICVPTGDGGVYRTRSIDPQEVRELPAAQSEDVVGIINNSVDNALTLLDSIYSSGRMMYYSDYCALHDAIAGDVSGR